MYVEPGRERDELTAALEREGYSPVYLDQNVVDLHYNGFCNTVLWQLFHYVPLNIGGWARLGRRGCEGVKWGVYVCGVVVVCRGVHAGMGVCRGVLADVGL